MWSALFAVASAATFDPQMTWRTVRTPHFHITFHQGLETVADEFAQEVEGIYDTMTEEMRWKPRRRTEVVLVDRTDSANGYATTVPYNAIVIFVTAPQEDSTLSLYEDWSEAIMTHELTHVLHMDTNHGIVRAARAVIGRIASTNDVSPLWMIEGLGTFMETRHTEGGRGRTPLVEMMKRTAVIEGMHPPLGNLDGLQPKPPSGNLRYLWGQDFMQYVADHAGEDVWTRWIHTYGAGLPYLLPSRKVFGRTLQSLYRDWSADMERRVAEQLAPVEALGVTPSRIVSQPDASCSGPRFSPDGDWLVWSCYDLRTGSALWRADGQGYAPEKLAQDRGAKNLTWRSDGKAFVYAASHTVNRFNTWSDIYLFDMASKSTTPLTNGARARDPDFSPDGSRLIVVTNGAELNQLEVATVDRRRVPITAATDHTQFATPRYAPDGRSIAVSVWAEGRRDLWLYSTDGVPLRRITADVTIDRDPAWSPDGRWLYFSSDRTGIPNVFAVEIETERLWQVTNVRTGAMKPDVSPDGALLAFQLYSQDGWDVHVMDLDPARFIDHGPLPQPLRYGLPLQEIVSSVPIRVPPRGAPVPVESPRADASRERPSRLARSRRTAGEPPGVSLACARWRSFDLLTPGVPAPLAFRDGCLQSPEERVDNFDMTDVKDAFGEEQEIDWFITPRRYNPVPTLLPRYALPFVQTTPFAPAESWSFVPWPRALQASVVSSGSDMLQHFAWSASANYRTDSAAFGGGASLVFNRYLPVFAVSASTAALPLARIAVVEPELDENGDPVITRTDAIYWERRDRLTASVSYPYRPRTTIFASYGLTWRRELFPIPGDAYLPLIPVRGRIGQLSGGWRYAWSQPTPYAISLEDARIFSLVGSVAHPLLGTSVKGDGLTGPPDERVDLTVAQVTAEVREYIVNPLIPNHVLAMKLGGGYTLGATQFLGNYQLGGAIGDNAFITTPDESRMLRGYAFATDFGDRYWLTSAEYRFPIAQIQRGVGTIPAFWRNVSGAVFVDAGNAFGDLDDWRGAFDGTLVGVGGELSLRWVLGWGAAVTGRLGYGVGLTPAPSLPDAQFRATDPRAFYFQLGGSF